MAQRYRVFLNEKVIRISEIINREELSPSADLVHFTGREQLRQDLHRFSSDQFDELCILAGGRCSEAIREFESLFLFLEAAGGIVVNRTGEILFIHRYGRWDLPKGKLEEKESAGQGALREVNEETGLKDLLLKNELPPTFHIYTDGKGIQVLKKTHWFRMEYHSNEKPVPQTVEGIDEVRWASRKEAAKLITGSYASLRELFLFYMQEPDPPCMQK